MFIRLKEFGLVIIGVVFLWLAVVLPGCGGGGGGGTPAGAVTGTWDNAAWDSATWGP